MDGLSFSDFERSSVDDLYGRGFAGAREMEKMQNQMRNMPKAMMDMPKGMKIMDNIPQGQMKGMMKNFEESFALPPGSAPRGMIDGGGMMENARYDRAPMPVPRQAALPPRGGGGAQKSLPAAAPPPVPKMSWEGRAKPPAQLHNQDSTPAPRPRGGVGDARSRSGGGGGFQRAQAPAAPVPPLNDFSAMPGNSRTSHSWKPSQEAHVRALQSVPAPVVAAPRPSAAPSGGGGGGGQKGNFVQWSSN